HASSHHRSLLSFPTRRSSDLSRLRSRASRLRVETSSPVVSPPSSSLGSSVRARFLPCSTPHWSKLFRFQMAPSASTLCSCSAMRSEEHTSELQSPYDLVCRLL